MQKQKKKLKMYGYVDVDYKGNVWRIVQMNDFKTMRYYHKDVKRFIYRKNPPIGIKHMWHLLSHDALGPEQ